MPAVTSPQSGDLLGMTTTDLRFDRGLSTAEARALLAKHGPNALPEARPRSLGDILRGTLREPMFLFLLAAAGLYLVVGDLGEGELAISARRARR